MSLKNIRIVKENTFENLNSIRKFLNLFSKNDLTMEQVIDHLIQNFELTNKDDLKKKGVELK